MEFDIKYQNVMMKIDKIIYSDYNPKSLKNFIEGYRIEENLREKEEKIRKEGNAAKRKKYVDWSEIKKHEKLYDKAKFQKMAQNELEKINNKQLEKEYISKIDEMGANKKRYGSYDKYKTNDNKLSNKNIKVKEFSKLVNRMNINKIQNQKKASNNFNGNNKKNNIQPLNKPNIKRNTQSSGGYTNQYLKRNQHSASPKISTTIPNESQENHNIIPIYKHKKLPAMNRNFEITENRYNIDKRTPLNIKPNYLHESLNCAKRKNGYEIKKYSNQNEFLNNLNDLRYQAQKSEDKAKKQEQLLKIQGSEYNMEACEKMSNYLCDSISAKIAILKQINQ